MREKKLITFTEKPPKRDNKKKMKIDDKVGILFKAKSVQNPENANLVKEDAAYQELIQPEESKV